MPDCKTCKENRQSVEPVPYIVHESAMARQERTIKRLWVALLVSICLWAATVGGVLYYESQFVEEEWTFEATTDNGGNAIANGNGEVYYYGDSESYPENQNP